MTDDDQRESAPNQGSQEGQEQDAVWTYRGYRIQPGEFNTAMVHLYRGELSRANAWRHRLDATTNWAVVTTGAAISIAFSQSRGHHSVILLNIFLVTLFLFIEARRYRYYELWSSRIRLMETDFFAGMLVPPFKPAWDWAENLAENLLQPSHPITMWEAFGRRFRRNYMWIYIIVICSWIAKLWLHPVKASSWQDLVTRANFLGLSGEYIFYFVGFMLASLLAIGILTTPLQEASGEVLPHLEEIREVPKFDFRPAAGKGVRAWFRPRGGRKQQLIHIITAQPEKIAEGILKQMNRGVTRMEGTGMYTGEDKTVLMIALTVTEVARLKALVRKLDPQAFMIVSPAEDVLGGGFEPIEKNK